MSSPSSNPEAPAARPVTYPLDEFYASAGLALPQLRAIQGDEMPEPYRSLLVHENDMTPTLESFHGGRIHIEVLSRRQENGYYFREVILHMDGSEKPVEFGAIKIDLNLFPESARKLILEERLPLGTILHDCRLVHLSRPTAFLEVLSDEFIDRGFKLEGTHTLYGRRNTLWTPEHKALADIVEILPPENPS